LSNQGTLGKRPFFSWTAFCTERSQHKKSKHFDFGFLRHVYSTRT
jgi:uncharacterized protein YktB (UPF0637 family)